MIFLQTRQNFDHWLAPRNLSTCLCQHLDNQVTYILEPLRGLDPFNTPVFKAVIRELKGQVIVNKNFVALKALCLELDGF